MPRPKIEIFRIYRSMGTSENWSSLKLIKGHKDALNEIGYTGKLNGVKITLEEFLNTYAANAKETYRVETLSMNSGEFKDTLLVIKATA